jgi:Double-GTPase 1
LRCLSSLQPIPGADRFEIVVPDVSGELWKTAVETCELPAQWMSDLASARGALLFVRIGSDQNVAPLDWVTAAKLLRMEGAPAETDVTQKHEIPTQVSLCELIRFMEYGLGTANSETRSRVAVLVTAWDRLDHERAAAGPTAYLAAEYPLLAGRLKDISKFDVRVFGLSVVGGDFLDEDFKQKFFMQNLKSAGYVVEEIQGRLETKQDLTLPVAWVVKATADT